MQRAPLKPQVILLGLAALLNDTASELIYPLLPVFLTATLGATPAVIGLVEGAADGLSSILKYFSGAWSDRWKRRKPLVVSGYGLAAASRLLIAVASAWQLVLPSYASHGVTRWLPGHACGRSPVSRSTYGCEI